MGTRIEGLGHSNKTKSAKGRGKVLEKDIQNEICDWLRKENIFFWRSNNVPVFSTSNDGVRRFRSLPKDTPRGLPDVMIVEQGKFIGVEVKREGMKLRPEQAEFGLRLIKADSNYIVAHSLSEFVLELSKVFPNE